MPLTRKQDEPTSPGPGKRSSVPTTSRPPASDGPSGIEPSPAPGT